MVIPQVARDLEITELEAQWVSHQSRLQERAVTMLEALMNRYHLRTR